METAETLVQQKHIDWKNISYTSLVYSDEYKLCLGTIGQVIMSLSKLVTSLDIKITENAYQEFLYPQLKELCNEITKKYEETFLNDLTTDYVQLEVFGANLNGSTNNGSLRYPIAVKGIPRNLRYRGSQFGQRLRVLIKRCEYLTTRDGMAVDRYKNDTKQYDFFIELQKKCKEFLLYLSEDVSTKWTEIVKKARTIGGIAESPKQVKLTKDNIKQYKSRQ